MIHLGMKQEIQIMHASASIDTVQVDTVQVDIIKG